MTAPAWAGVAGDTPHGHPEPAPLVLADEERVGTTAAELIVNRLWARPRLRVLLREERMPPALSAVLRRHAERGRLPRGEATFITGLEDAADGPALDVAVIELESAVQDRALPVLLGARELLVIATGADRAAALRGLLMQRPPGAPLRTHPRLTVICDQAAARDLPRHDGRGHVCVVLGHREPSISAEHRISHESLGRVQRAEWVARRRPTLAAVLTGYTSTGGLSEAEQMRAAWRLADVPPLLEVAGRDTAENATRSLPLLLALGDVRHVTVVTSAWHVRAPYHFLPWRRYGLDVSFAFDWHGDWARMLAHELRGLRSLRADRRNALATMALSHEELER
jgi:DUF218 domain-containing protein